MKINVYSAVRVVALITLLFAASRVAFAQMPSSCVVGTNVYYVDNVGGADTFTQSQAKSKSTPWAHAPYMNSWQGKVTYTHSPGDCFIFKGGDSWAHSDLPVIMKSGGNSSVQDYYGVDLTWFTGSAFTRPILDNQSNVTPYALLQYASGYITWDNVEVRNMSCDTSHTESVVDEEANHGSVMTNSYVHLFQPPMGGCGSNSMNVWITGGSPPCDGLFAYNVVDGSDGNGGGYSAGVNTNSCDNSVHNVMHDLCNGNNSYAHLVAYNTIYNIGSGKAGFTNCGSGGFHSNAIQNDTDADIHDNLVFNSGGQWIEVSPQGTAAHPVSHVYNNVVYQTPSWPIASPPSIQIGTGGHSPNKNGVVFIENNTIQCDIGDNDGCIFFENTTLPIVTIDNNHQINSSGTAEICINNAPFNNSACPAAAAFTYNASSERYDTIASAAAAGYTQSETYVYSPTSASSPTVGIGQDDSSECSAVVFLCTDTMYGSAQGIGNVSVPGRATNSRTGSWGAGAYQFSSDTSGQPNAPTGLIATVQ